MKTAFLILTANPHDVTIRLREHLSFCLKDMDVYILTDSQIDGRRGDNIIYMDSLDFSTSGYHSSSPLIRKTPISWDRALYFFKCSNYDFAWFCEDDVFIHYSSAEYFVNLRNDNSDLLCPMLLTKSQNPNWPNWKFAEVRFPESSHMGGFLPLCRISRRLSDLIDAHVIEFGSLSFIETMIPSICKSNDLTMNLLEDLNKKVFRYGPAFTEEELISKFRLSGCNIFHPVKNFETQSKLLFNKIEYKYFIINYIKYALMCICRRFNKYFLIK